MEETSLSTLLATISEAVVAASASLPTADALVPPADGISLLDTKNELLLSYLQNVVFLIILRLRGGKLDAEDGDSGQGLGRLVVQKLVELRLFLEKGVRPLETKLKYQIDKVLKAAEQSKDKAISNGDTNGNGGAEGPSDLSFRPNPLAISQAKETPTSKSTADADGSAPYRPPRINPTTMPTLDPKPAKRAEKSSTLLDFVENELSTAPMAEPSIGTTIMSSGRQNLSSSERAQRKERRRYEEENFKRLPTTALKKEKKSQRRKDVYGGEEFVDLSRGADRISRLTTGKKVSVADQAKKRAAERGTSNTEAPGARWEKRRKILDARK